MLLQTSCSKKDFAKAILAYIFVLASGCTTHSRIHLYVSDEGHIKSTLIASLSKKDFKVEEFTAPIPDIKSGNYIVYYPDDETDNLIDTINHTLRQHGLSDAQPIPFKIGSGLGAHEYTEGNAGLYLIDKSNEATGVAGASDQEVEVGFTDQYFGSMRCERSYILELHDNHEASVFDDNSQRDLAKGKWSVSGSDITIKRFFRSHTFNVVRRSITIDGHNVPVIDLIPKPGNSAPFNCDYSTHYIEGVYKLPLD